MGLSRSARTPAPDAPLDGQKSFARFCRSLRPIKQGNPVLRIAFLGCFRIGNIRFTLDILHPLVFCTFVKFYLCTLRLIRYLQAFNIHFSRCNRGPSEPFLTAGKSSPTVKKCRLYLDSLHILSHPTTPCQGFNKKSL